MLETQVDLPLNQILLGDCVEVLRSLPDNSVDSVVTDPPYGLNRIKNIPKLIQAWLAGEDGVEHQTRGFCQSEWDVLPSPRVWREVLRVLKPGGYTLVFAGTRTYDLMGLSLRLAGFEISENLNWCFGQGFPKSKKMLKPAHEPILVCYKPGKREDFNIDECRITLNGEKLPTGSGKMHTWRELENRTDLFVSSNKETPATGRYPSNFLLSHHPDCVACGTKRVKTESGATKINKSKVTHDSKNIYGHGTNEWICNGYNTSPGNTEEIAAYSCSENCPVRLLNEQTAEMRASKPSKAGSRFNANKSWLGNNEIGDKYSDGNGSANASRFFLNLEPEAPFVYQPKASRSDRTIGGKVENTHITVKPVNLMSFLVRLVTPADGVCLDPFIGSGSTALGCIRENRNYIGIEREPEYHAIALQRIAASQEKTPEAKPVTCKDKVKKSAATTESKEVAETMQLSLF